MSRCALNALRLCTECVALRALAHAGHQLDQRVCQLRTLSVLDECVDRLVAGAVSKKARGAKNAQRGARIEALLDALVRAEPQLQLGRTTSLAARDQLLLITQRDVDDALARAAALAVPAVGTPAVPAVIAPAVLVVGVSAVPAVVV